MPRASSSTSRRVPAFDSARAREILWRLDRAIASGEGITGEQEDLVENQVPEGVEPAGLEHARFLFLTVPCDRGTKSSALWARAKEAHQKGSPLFDIEAIADGCISRDYITALLTTSLKPRYANPAAQYWQINATRLDKEFGGDPRRLFGSSGQLPDVYRLIRSFAGFGPKTGGMMLRAAIGLGWACGDGIEAIEIPVDIHDARITLQTGVMRLGTRPGEELSPVEIASFARPVRQFLTEVCAAEGLEWPGVDRALWLIGSRGCARGRCSACPLFDFCSVPRQLELTQYAAG